ncbi:ACR211Wp [Eremothecium gossypii ATCC 10895]|uniref:ACR211Wp n=1 Tax=Eremothecium gossypii (strain ATCC 10895 / CBS 109.51 / FGSC 9923 / NRRL Y-1056) TaxID=284811 RepID=Q75BR0_EREGS|nr:ACR211Wp [Eremothecium gossypii ATCC 10895]AAS51437.2 ACR211Wp [Eremothecium gossypii ATCC 10895]AEY95728.1 FACR211Wp [Eremothecium gossypii FDAG1]
MKPIGLTGMGLQSAGDSGEELKSGWMPAEMPLGEYMFRRLMSAGTKTVFGVPGDFNMGLLEHMYGEAVCAEGLQWIGTCNELNAAYAADGYSRYCNKIGCVVTTLGVGELSALNGVAGAFAEHVKVLHIVGVSMRAAQTHPELHGNVHHLVPRLRNSNFEAPNHKVYSEMVSGRVSCCCEFLEDLETACDQIDHVIREIWRHGKPGYLFVPADMPNMKVSSRNLVQAPTIMLESAVLERTNLAACDRIGIEILQHLYQSSTPAILCDGLCDRFGLTGDVRRLVELTGMWNFSTIMGKSILDETQPHYKGVYYGAGSKERNALLQECDLILYLGPVKDEVNTWKYTFQFNPQSMIIELHPEYVSLTRNGEQTILNSGHLLPVLRSILAHLNVANLSFNYPTAKKRVPREHQYAADEPITQGMLQHMIPECLNPGDVMVVDTGTFQFSVFDMKFPTDLKCISQSFYLSIGMALPAALGVACAMREFPRLHLGPKLANEGYTPRLVLCEGDGAAQMTIQELSTFIRYELPVEVLLWNNDGYTVERVIKGPTRSYNDIMSWDWTKLLRVFGDFDGTRSESVRVKDFNSLIEHLSSWKSDKKRSKIRLMEVILDKMDISATLKELAKQFQHNAA